MSVLKLPGHGKIIVKLFANTTPVFRRIEMFYDTHTNTQLYPIRSKSRRNSRCRMIDATKHRRCTASHT